MAEVEGWIRVQREGLVSYLSVHLRRSGIKLLDRPRENTLFFITDDIEQAKQSFAATFLYAIVYSESLKTKLEFLRAGALAIFKFPFIVDEIARVIENHIKIFRREPISVVRSENSYKLNYGFEILRTSYEGLYVLRYRNRIVRISGREARVLVELLGEVTRSSEGGVRHYKFGEGPDFEIAPVVYRLRQKLQVLRAPFTIKNIYGYGYFIKSLAG